MKLILLSLAVLLFLMAAVMAKAEAAEEPTREALTETIIKDKFFRRPVVVLWNYFGKYTRTYAIQVRHGFISDEVLPNPFSQLGLVPTAIVADVIYESGPGGEEGDAIWSEVIAYYDNLFDLDYLEGRVIYNDIKLDSYLGSGLGLALVDDGWVGGYYLGSEGFMLNAEVAYLFDDRFWLYGNMQYYIESNEEWERRIEGEVGVVFDDLIYLAVQEREDEWIYMLGISQEL